MKIEREKAIRFSMLVTVLVIVSLSVVLGVLLGSEGKLKAGFRSPRITPTASALPSATTAQVKVTPAPTPIQVQVQRDYPPNAVDVRADGKLLYTAVNARAARKALEQYLAETAGLNLAENERLLRAGFDQTLTLEEPSGDGELLQVEEAVNTLKADEGLLPISRTVVRCVIDRGEIQTVTRENPLLAAGSRIYRSIGVSSFILSYYETTYRGQAAFSEVKTNEFAVGQGKADQVIEDGSLILAAASAEAGPAAAPIEGFAPQWPVAGTVETSFGMVDGLPHYGIDIAAENGARAASPAEGVIVYCGPRGQLGLVIDVLHDETGCLSRIIGCERAMVELYQRVRKGEPVGVLPQSPSGNRAVLRYELLVNGLPVNPEKYLPKK